MRTNAQINKKYTLITTVDSSHTDFKNVEKLIRRRNADLINKYEHKQSNLSVTKTFTGLDEADETIAQTALGHYCNRPNINPTAADSGSQENMSDAWLGRRCEERRLESGLTWNIGDKYNVTER